MQQRQTNKIDSGRSMVEMLGVMAIMGMLSVVVIFGIRLGLDKAKANQIIKDARLAHTSLVTQPMGEPTDWMEPGFIPSSQKVIRKRINRDQQPEVIVSDIEPRVCHELLKFVGSGKVRFYDPATDILLEACGEENQNIKIMFDMAADEELDHACVNKDDCDNGWCDDGVCVPCPAGETPNEAGDGCTIFCNENQITCYEPEEQGGRSWCCSSELGCTPEFGVCPSADGTCSWEYTQGDLTATCSWTFIETPAASECSATYTQQPRLASCHLTFGEVANSGKSGGNNGSVTGIIQDNDCPAGSYCYVQFKDENCNSNLDDNSTGTLYGVCNPLSAKQDVCTRKSGLILNGNGCPAGRYCVLTFTDDTCAGAIADDTVGTIYGVCSPLSSNEARCIKGAELKANENSACPEGQYCNLNFTDQTCENAIQNDSQGELWGTCIASSSNEARCVRPFTMSPKSYCFQDPNDNQHYSYCLLAWDSKTCSTIGNDARGEIFGKCVKTNITSAGDCPYTD